MTRNCYNVIRKVAADTAVSQQTIFPAPSKEEIELLRDARNISRGSNGMSGADLRINPESPETIEKLRRDRRQRLLLNQFIEKELSKPDNNRLPTDPTPAPKATSLSGKERVLNFLADYSTAAAGIGLGLGGAGIGAAIDSKNRWRGAAIGAAAGGTAGVVGDLLRKKYLA